MKLEGGCYCGQVRYVAEGDPMMQAQCHCRECQYITGGAPNLFMAIPVAGFKFTKGTRKAVCPQGSRTPGDARILPRMRHTHDDPAAGFSGRHRQGRHARRSKTVHAEGCDLHHRQAGVPPDPGRHGDVSSDCRRGAEYAERRRPAALAAACGHGSGGGRQDAAAESHFDLLLEMLHDGAALESAVDADELQRGEDMRDFLPPRPNGSNMRSQVTRWPAASDVSNDM